MNRKHNFVLDKNPKKIWSLNQLRVGETIIGIPYAEHWKNKKGNDFVLLKLDYGHAICNIYFLIFSFPIQKLLHNKYVNSFELVRFYREVNGIPVDDDITQLHDINWQDIIDFLNNLQILKIQVVSKSMNGFNNIRFVSFTRERLYDNIEKCNWRLD